MLGNPDFDNRTLVKSKCLLSMFEKFLYFSQGLNQKIQLPLILHQELSVGIIENCDGSW